jgi:hypothetical protein
MGWERERARALSPERASERMRERESERETEGEREGYLQYPRLPPSLMTV